MVEWSTDLVYWGVTPRQLPEHRGYHFGTVGVMNEVPRDVGLTVEPEPENEVRMKDGPPLLSRRRRQAVKRGKVPRQISSTEVGLAEDHHQRSQATAQMIRTGCVVVMERRRQEEGNG